MKKEIISGVFTSSLYLEYIFKYMKFLKKNLKIDFCKIQKKNLCYISLRLTTRFNDMETEDTDCFSFTRGLCVNSCWLGDFCCSTVYCSRCLILLFIMLQTFSIGDRSGLQAHICKSSMTWTLLHPHTFTDHSLMTSWMTFSYLVHRITFQLLFSPKSIWNDDSSDHRAHVRCLSVHLRWAVRRTHLFFSTKLIYNCQLV